MKTSFIFGLLFVALQFDISTSHAQQALEDRSYSYTVSNENSYWADWNWPRYLGGYDAKNGDELSPLEVIHKLGKKNVRSPIIKNYFGNITPELLKQFKKWEGYCDAVSEASVLFSEPVDVESSIGRISAHQIKGMVAYYLTMRRFHPGVGANLLGRGTFALNMPKVGLTTVRERILSPYELISFVEKQMKDSDKPVIVNFREPPMIGNSVLVSYQQSFTKVSDKLTKLIIKFKYLPEMESPCVGSCKGSEFLLDGEFAADLYFENGHVRGENWTSDYKPYFAWVPDAYDIFNDEKIPAQVRDIFKRSFNYNSTNLIGR